MIKSAFWGLLAAIMLSSAAYAQSRCEPRAELGWILEFSAAQNASEISDRPTVTTFQGAVLPVRAGDEVCVGDQIRNPKGSGLRLHVVAFDHGGWLEPGDQVAPLPPFGMWWDANMDRFDSVVHGVERVLPPAYARTAEDRCRYAPQESATPLLFGQFVRKWGPAFFTWPCGPNEEGPWFVTVSEAGRPQDTYLSDTNAAFVDFDRQCEVRCELTVEKVDPKRTIVFDTQLVVVDAAEVKLPDWLDKASDAERGPTAIAAFLLQKQQPDVWRNQAQSLLIFHACRSPVAKRLASRLLAPSGPLDLCKMPSQIEVQPRG